jgi:acyl-CoA reductase-like NAD-dependent aldehyde dehydrogenase
VPSPRGLVEALAPALAAGATAVVVAAHGQPRAAGLLAELLVGSELPAGAANVLTGDLPALGPALARADVDGFDPGDDAGDAMAVAAARGAGVLRVGTADPGVARLRAWTTTAAVWHPAGS